MRKFDRREGWALATSLGALLALAGCGSSATGATPGQSTGEPAHSDDSALSGQAGAAASATPASSSNGSKSAAGKAGAGASAGAAGSGAAGSGSRKDPNEPLSDETDFVSADTQSSSRNSLSIPAQSAAEGGAAGSGAATPATPPRAASDVSKDASTGSARSVERGDIYRVLGDQRILNLNAYRGVQILDVSDVNHPRVEGRLAVAGDPVELYVVDDRAIVLLNNWQGYYGARDDVKVESVSGGLVLSVDIKDRAHPTLIEQTPVPGTISTSRLTQGGNQAALYVASMDYTQQQQQAVLKSFDVTGGKLTEKSELNLGGYVQDIQATTDVLMFATNDYNTDQNRSQVTVVDISSPDGKMLRGGTVTVQGIVQNKFNMDAYNGVLRVASGANWNGAFRNHLQTFSLKDMQKLSPIDDCIFGQRDPQSGQSEMLYATVFVENRGFFVTYYRKDPFHAFSIDDSGKCQEHSQFVVSGWNDFLRPTLDDTRLIGIGHNDANNARTLSVSLYDAVDLDNANPLEARADIDLNGSYSEASWDDRGFSVIEDAVSVKAADGSNETGLVLLPFEGWDAQKQQSVAQVQIFTFSDHTLTKRGSMDHGSSVRRSFEVKDGTTGNLSEDQLSLFDTGNPDAPKELGRVDVAPNYSHVFVYGDYIARVREPNTNGYVLPVQSSGPAQPQPKASVQILKRDSDVDGSDVVTSFEVPGGSDLTQVGKLLVSITTTVSYDNSGANPPKYQSSILVFDLSDPPKPHMRGSLDTDRLEPSYYGGPIPLAGKGGVAVDCADCSRPRYPYGGSAQHFTLGDALAFTHVTSQQKSLGQVTQCYINANSNGCSVDKNGTLDCGTPYYVGGLTCTTPQGGQETCEGQFYACDSQGSNCKPVDKPAGTTKSCNTFEQFRYWSAYAFDTLDLRNPDAPTLSDRVEMGKDEEGSSVIAADRTLYFNYSKPFSKKDDAHSYVKRFVRLIDFADPGKPSVGDGINVPGDVIEADGTTLYTRDFVWNDNDRRTLVGRVVLSGNTAHLQASKLFADRSVTAVKRDGVGHVLVSSDPAYDYGGAVIAAPPSSGGAPEQPKSQLSLLDDQSLDTVGEADVDSWATFKDAKQGRALYQVGGGLLVFNVEDAAHPKAQAYFPTAGWPSDILFDGQSILFAAGQYGVYRFDASVFNLLMK